MEISRQLLFFFSALGAFNGLLLSCYFLFFYKPKHRSNYFLGMLLLMLSIRIAKSVFLYFNENLAFGYLQIGISACVFIGPFLYFYIHSVIKPHGHISKTWINHIGVILPIVIIGSIYYPFEHHMEVYRFQVLNWIYYLWLAYWILSAMTMKDVLKKLLIREQKINGLEKWLITILIGNVLIWAAYYFWGYGTYILGALSFSFMMYLMVVLMVFRQRKTSISYQTLPKYGDKKIDSQSADIYIDKLQELMTDQQLYTNPNLKLPELAEELGVSTHVLSQLLNDNLNKSFTFFINEYRVEAAKQLIKEDSPFTLESIGYECGFNSKSTFFATFKKFTKTTPAKYRASMLNT